MNKLGNQILLLTTALLVLTAMAIMGSVWSSTAGYAERQVNDELTRAVNIFQESLGDRSQRLFASASVLTADFGFKQAVATQDLPTLRSALQNQGRRIAADLMLITDLEGRVTASIHSDDAPPSLTELSASLVKQAIQDDGVASFLVEDHQLYQIIVIPVKAPLPIALAGIGFKLDQRFTGDLLNVTGLNLSLVHTHEGLRQVLTSTLPEAQQAEALAAPKELVVNAGMLIGERQRFISQPSVFVLGEGDTLELVLSASLDKTFDEFDRIRNRILIITLMVLVLASLGSLVLSRSLAEPLARLGVIAEQIAGGDYHHIPFIKTRTRELHDLFYAFVAMRNEIKEREQRILYQTSHDQLTQLLNRHTLLTKFSQRLLGTGSPLIFLSINVRGFRQVNDTFGPDVGDKCLIIIGERLRFFADLEPLVARAGADEFMAAYPVPDRSTPHVLAEKIQARLAEPFIVGTLSLPLVCDIGVATSPEHGETADILERRSGIALDKARQTRAGLRFYETGEDEAHLERLILLNELKLALGSNDGQLQMYYQPKLNLQSGKIDKCEALIRWIHPTRKFVSPEVFVSLAEQSGLISTLTDWVLDTVLRQLAIWKDAGVTLQVAINISAQDLGREEL
ncbi:MAG: diguanylate cyclase [Hahellaceae bacterium]|nr:diguanylate cyclase [Hahellaceae bacterium]